MADLSIQGEVVVNSEKAESAFDRVGDRASQMANEVATSAGKAGQAVDKIGDGAGASAEKFTRAESRISASIKRATNELELLGKTASQRLEFNIADKGLDAAKFEPALKKLREIEAQALQAQRAATGSLDKMGISAGQTAAALRQLPAQFTDIVTSLQGGQAPLTVLLQQGGQIKDSFGGAGSAVRELGGYVAGLVNPFTMAAAAIASIAVAYKQGSAEADGYRMALVMTGNAAGTTAAQMQQMAGRISSVVGTQGAAAEALAQMASSGRVASQSLEYFSEVAIKFERTTGTAISETVKRFAELGASPVDASRKLNAETNYLTASIYEQIKALKDQGREADAAALAQNTYADALNNRSAQITQNLGAIEGAWKAIKDAAKSGWDAMLNVGRADSLGTQIDNMRAKIAQAKGQDKNRPFSMPWDTSLADLEKQLSFLTEQERVIRRGAEAQAQRTQAEKEAIAATDALQKTQASGLTNQQKMNKALEEYARHIEKLKATNPASVLLSPDAIARGEKAIRDQFSDKGKGSAGIKAVNKDLADQQRIFAELAGVSSAYYSELANYQKQRAAGVVTEDQYVAAVEKLIQKQPFAVELAKEETEANKALSKSYAEAAAERLKTIQSMERAADGLQSQNDALRDEIELIGLTAEQQTLVLQQRNEAIILTKEATLAELERQSVVTGTMTREQIALAAQIEQLRERNELLGVKVDRTIAADAAKDAASDWKRTAADIERSLTDGLMRGFESGKGFAQNLISTLKNMFKTMVLRPVISAIINPISQGITGMMGLSGAAQAGQGMSAIGAAGNLFSAGSALGGLGAVGGALSGFTTAATASIQSLVGMSGTVAQMTTSLAAAGHTAASGVSAGVQAFQAIPGWGWAIAGIAALAAIFSKKATPHAGGASTYSEAGGLVSSADIYRSSGLADTRTYNAEISTALTGNVAKAIGDTLNATAKAFGQTAGYEITTAFADDTSKDGAWGSLMIRRGGESVIDWRDTQTSKWAPREFADGEAGGKEYLAEVAKSARDALVQAIGDVGWANDMLTALGESPTLEGLAGTVQQINAAQAAFESLGKNIVGFGALTDGAISQLVKAAGGIEGLVSAASTYYDNFYSEAEKTANVTRDITAALADVGLQMPATRDEFRALVESQMALGDAGTDAVAALLGVSGAFASVTAASETAADAAARLADEQAKAAEAAARAAEEAARRAEEIARERYGLETQIMQLLGDTAGLRMREIEALDASNRALQEHIYAIEDARAAYEKSITAAQSAYSVLESSIGTDRSALQSALDAEREAISARYKLQQDGHAAQLSAAQSAADKMRGIASMLSVALGRLAVESPALDRARLQSARGVIGAAAASSNVMAPGLEAALSVVTDDVRKLYGKWEDFAFDQGVTAGQAAALSSAAKSQLTGYESIVNALRAQDDVSQLLADAEMAAAQERFEIESKKLDERLEQGKSMLDRLLGIEEGTLSSVEALARLTDAVNAGNAALQAQRAAEAAARFAVSAGGSGGGYDIQSALWAAQESAIMGQLKNADFLKSMGLDAGDLETAIANAAWQATGGAAYAGSTLLSDALARLSGTDGNTVASAAVSALRASGSLLYDGGATNFSGSGYHDVEKMRELERLLGFDGSHANGLAYVPFDGYRAELHRGERVLTQDEARVYTPPAVVASMLRSGGASDGEILAELRAMRQRLEAIEAASNATAGATVGTKRALDRVVGNDALRTRETP